MWALGVGAALWVAMSASFSPAARATCCAWSGGADLLSGVVWRGVEYARAPTFEPWISARGGALSLDGYSSLATDGSWAEGSFRVGLGATGRLGGARVVGEAHVFPRSERDYASPVGEVGVEYRPPMVPVQLAVTRNVLHDAEHATQAEVAVGGSRGASSIALFGNVALNASGYYGARAGEVLQYGVSVEHGLAASRRIGAVLALTALRSPAHARGWLVAQVGLYLPREP